VDVDVFLRVLEYRDGWMVSEAVRVNQDRVDPNDIADQFTPSVTVDGSGRVHVVFHDDRRFHQVDGQSGAKLDVYYVVGRIQGPDQQFVVDAERRLYSLDPNDPNDPYALDLGFWIRGPGEYGGVAYDPFRDEVLTSYTGTDPNKPGDFKAVIYSNRITDLP